MGGNGAEFNMNGETGINCVSLTALPASPGEICFAFHSPPPYYIMHIHSSRQTVVDYKARVQENSIIVQGTR